MRFYLAGGMRGRPWQSEVILRLSHSGHEFINPMDHGLGDPLDYTLWDLGGVAVAEGVIAYLEKGNPSGIGLSLEVGMAIGMGKTVYFANEQYNHQYWQIVNNACSYTFRTLDALMDAIERQNLPGNLPGLPR